MSRPKRIISWDGKDEDHPFERYPHANNNATKLILGSFPPNKFTIYSERRTRCDIQFFYGSKDNSFWDLFISAKGLSLKWQDDFEQLKEWLQKNEWIITDIVKKSTRKKDSSTDSDLQPKEWNNKMINEIFQKNPIKTLVFTSNWVKRNFDKYIAPSLNNIGSYAEVILISPSPAGLISTNWANEYLKKKSGESAEQYRARYYKWALNT